MQDLAQTFLRRALSLVAASLLFACQASSPSPSVVIRTAAGKEVVVRVEIADEPEEQMRGLMYRTELADDTGMLFLFDREQPRSFWMKNTPLPLDIIYIAADGRIVSIAERTTPHSTAPIKSAGPAQNVLEVNGGFAAAHGIRAGDRVSYRGAGGDN